MQKIIELVIFLLIVSFQLEAQVAPNKYRIYFIDKNNTDFTIDHPEEFLSEKAIIRRVKQNIQIVENDLPVSDYYIDSLKSLGITVLNTSKWLNTATIYTTNQTLLDTLHKISFIKSIKSAKNNTIKDHQLIKLSPLLSKTYSLFDYGESGKQISLHNGHVLHENGYLGQGITIAVIDAGFYNTDILPAFDSLFANDQILETYDFVSKNTSVFEDHNHGMSVLSIIGGNIPGKLIGSAPKANFLLLRSEDASSEYSIEEDNWAAAAEYADSAGADIINTSLGYTVFDDPDQNYEYNDMDGNTTFITQAADIAASKGILVIVSAGNEGNSAWKYISAPADADSVLAVGAINEFADYVSFSSQGPTSDGRIKPNVVAMGYQTVIQDVSGQVIVGNGTSFSAPVITGLSACLWQSLPNMTNMEIIDRIQQSSHQYSHPDNMLGYGIPDFARAANISNLNQDNKNINFLIKAFPNPFTDQFSIYLDSQNPQFYLKKIEIFNLLGEKVYQKELIENNNEIIIDRIENLPSGLYIVTIITDRSIHQIRVSKI